MSHFNAPSAPARPAAAPAAAVPWQDPARERAFGAWLQALAPVHGLRVDSVRAASSDASFRRYLRVDAQGGASFIVMDAPPALEDCQPFVHVQALMQGAGLHVPEVLAWERAQGFLLLTDLGQHTVIEHLDERDPQAAHAWYVQALEVLLQWQLATRAGALPAYDAPPLHRELQLFPEWYVSRHRGMALSAPQQAVLARTFETLVAHNLAAPSVFVHRDFMMRNLMVGQDGRLGVLDFQDAVLGPVTYDIASLMRDAFISWEEDFVLDLTVRYWERARRAGLVGTASASGFGADFGEFYRAVDWMALQRHLKVAGIFARLTLRDGKPRYLADAPRFIAYIRQTAGRYRELKPLLRLVDEIEGTAAAEGYAFGRMGPSVHPNI